MTVAPALGPLYGRLGESERTFRCCDTTFTLAVAGYRAESVAERGERIARELEAELNAFDPGSAVASLNRTDRVENGHVAALVRRGLEYHDLTEGVFDVRQGRLEHGLKAYLRGDGQLPTWEADPGEVTVDGDRVEADSSVDLNGLAKGYVVDRVADSLAGVGRRGFVNGGGDMSPPPGPVAIESPYGDAEPLKLLDTTWNVATSGGYRRSREGTDHVYDPTTDRLGSRHDSVTVVAERDCTEADALATTLAAMPLEDALTLATGWPGAEALVVHAGVFHSTDGFEAHVVER